MTETITITVQSACMIFLTGITGGVLTGFFLVRTYVRSRGIKTKAQKELTRLARFVKVHHPEAVREAAVVASVTSSSFARYSSSRALLGKIEF